MTQKETKLNKKIKYSFSKAKDDNISLDFHNYNYWESVDEIPSLLGKIYNVEIIRELDGPATRYKELKIEENDFTLHYTSYGSFMSSTDESSKEFLKKIKLDLERLDS